MALETLRPYVDTGKVKWISLSECSADYLRRARAVPGIGEKVIACQMEYSPFELEIEKSGQSLRARSEDLSLLSFRPW